jgi:hypothetical protein
MSAAPKKSKNNIWPGPKIMGRIKFSATIKIVRKNEFIIHGIWVTGWALRIKMTVSPGSWDSKWTLLGLRSKACITSCLSAVVSITSYYIP